MTALEIVKRELAKQTHTLEFRVAFDELEAQLTEAARKIEVLEGDNDGWFTKVVEVEAKLATARTDALEKAALIADALSHICMNSDPNVSGAYAYTATLIRGEKEKSP